MSRISAALTDRIGTRFEAEVIGPRRRELLADVRGTVLEIGAGTGANLAHYPSEVELVLTEPDPHMRRRLRRREELAERSSETFGAPAEDLPVADASVDVVVTTFVLCSVDDPAAAIAEIRRVLRPQGRLLFLEHVRSEDGATARWQDRLTPVTRRLGGGCHVNRDTVASVRAAGFRVDTVATYLPANRLEGLQPTVSGRATVDEEPAQQAHGVMAGDAGVVSS